MRGGYRKGSGSKKGILKSDIHKQRIKENHKGMKGKKHNEKTRKKMSKLRKGKNHWNWKGGLRQKIKK